MRSFVKIKTSQKKLEIYSKYFNMTAKAAIYDSGMNWFLQYNSNPVVSVYFQSEWKTVDPGLTDGFIRSHVIWI